MRPQRTAQYQPRKGTITILAAAMSVVLIGMVAFCVDIGYVLSAKEELQRTADSSALAACWEFGQRLSDGATSAEAADYARITAVEYASLNKVTGKGLILDPNTSNDPSGDIVFGYISDFDNPSGTFQASGSDKYNAVRIRTHKDSSVNGEVPYFFARIFGLEGQVLNTEATAAIVRDVAGFKIPSNGGNINILPFALDENSWNNLGSNTGNDNYRWNPDTGQVEAGSDGFVEVNLFPQGTGSPGNRGTVDIGGNNNSTADLARQILEGVSPADMNALYSAGRSLEFDASGELLLNGDTGISAGVKDELAAIQGLPRVIPIFSSVSGNGNNAEYTVTKWQGIRVMAIKLTGSMSQKHVTIQVAPVQSSGIIPSDSVGTSEYVYSNVVLVQ